MPRRAVLSAGPECKSRKHVAAEDAAGSLAAAIGASVRPEPVGILDMQTCPVVTLVDALPLMESRVDAEVASGTFAEAHIHTSAQANIRGTHGH